MILRTDVFPNGVIIVRIKSNDESAPLTKVVYEPSSNLPSSDYPQALSIAQVLWTPEVIANFQPN